MSSLLSENKCLKIAYIYCHCRLLVRKERKGAVYSFGYSEVMTAFLAEMLPEELEKEAIEMQRCKTGEENDNDKDDGGGDMTAMIYHNSHDSVLESSLMWVDHMKDPINNKLPKQVSSLFFLVICYEVRYFGE
ncbi:hypothetical protein JRQ81_003020 [Phrynocephalus forsythii]|uniref:Uncharacterized protein n=1 Tax=Phrynocephalus forsythii TaxID=171643 RepID=A0A9Q1AX79_9SAUR|nr:hypothetical protein JRQ81_003020 [Phrynocephalus forsythii]